MKAEFRLGETTVYGVTHGGKRPGPTMINVHDDEDTSVEAGKASLEEFGGRLVELVHTGMRLITLKVEGKEYAFDPNRIFSDAGIENTLRTKSSYSQAAHVEIKRFAREYLGQFALDREPVIIALHNTSDGTFSVQSFMPSGEYGRDAAAAFASPRRDKFDFFYVTEQRFFDHLKKRDFNVVLQDNAQVTEDGSLSVHFAKRGIPYVNVEAEIGNLKNQIGMVKAAQEMWREMQG